MIYKITIIDLNFENGRQFTLNFSEALTKLVEYFLYTEFDYITLA